MQIKQGRFIARIYYGELATPRGNVLAFFYRDKPAEANEWTFQYRFRYYVDDKIHQSADVRSQSYIFDLSGTFEELEPKIRQILTLMTMAARSPFPEEVMVDSADLNVVEALMNRQPWCHPEDAINFGITQPVGIA